MYGYQRKRTYAGKRKYVRKGLRRVRKTTTSVKRLNRQVSLLRKRVNHNTATQNLTERIADLALVDQPYTFYNLTNWSNKTPVFATTAVDWNASNKLYHKRMTIDCRLTAGNELDLIGYRVFLVTLKDNANVPARWNSGTGGLALTANLDYVNTSFGKAMLNPRVFSIIKMKDFFTTAQGSASSGNAGNQLVKEWKWTIYPKHTVYNPTGNVSSMVTSFDPSKCYYILIFNDNVSGDLQAPLFYSQVYHSVVPAQ